jgi:hypothetical protein
MATRAICILLMAAACSPATTSSNGANDNAQLVGTWVGTSTISSGGQSGSVVATLHIASGALGLVTLDICPDQSLVNATVTSPTAFALVVPFTCPAGAVNGCSSAALTYTSGSGTLGGAASDAGVSDGGVSDAGTADAGTPGTLTFTGTGTLAGCQGSSPVTVSFTGTKM